MSTDQSASTPNTETARPAGEKVINLALQGGGSHGAFTWGVLDRLLEEPRLCFEGITATSAGAFNAVALADGLAAGGREGARKTLRNYWQKVADISSRGIFRPSPFDKADPDHGLKHSPGYLFMESLTYFASPYQMNPFNLNPLKDLLAETIDFKRVREQQSVWALFAFALRFPYTFYVLAALILFLGVTAIRRCRPTSSRRSTSRSSR
jgi:NTE family protein